MVFVSVTRLRIRSWRFMPAFLVDVLRTSAQVRRAEGFLAGSLLADRRRAFWTTTLWRGQADMKRYMTDGAHRRAMPRLTDWCDEASIAHWHQPDAIVPDWAEADRRMRADGRPSRVRHPTVAHRTMDHAPPRATGGVAIRSRR